MYIVMKFSLKELLYPSATLGKDWTLYFLALFKKEARQLLEISTLYIWFSI